MVIYAPGFIMASSFTWAWLGGVRFWGKEECTESRTARQVYLLIEEEEETASHHAFPVLADYHTLSKQRLEFRLQVRFSGTLLPFVLKHGSKNRMAPIHFLSPPGVLADRRGGGDGLAPRLPLQSHPSP